MSVGHFTTTRALFADEASSAAKWHAGFIDSEADLHGMRMRTAPFLLVLLFPGAFVWLCASEKGVAIALPGIVFMLGTPLLDFLLGSSEVDSVRDLSVAEDFYGRLTPLLFIALYIGAVIA